MKEFRMSKWMTQLTKQFGKVAQDLPEMEVVSLPSPSLNWAVGNGGLGEGKAICFYGPESGGKSLLSLLTMIEIQKKDPNAIVAWFDAEYSFNKDWFAKLGGDLTRLVVYQTNDPVKIFDFMWNDVLEMCQDGMPLRGVVIDSVKSILYPGDVKGKSTDITMGGSGAKYLGPAFKRLLPVIRDFGITTCLVQQVYEELDQYKAMANPYKIPDGRSLKHFCDYMCEVTKIETQKGKLLEGKNMLNADQQVGHKVRVKVKKNRAGAPARTAEFALKYDEGIVDTENELFDLAKSLGVIFHPISPNTGRPSNMLWQFGDMAPVKGEANMRAAIAGDIIMYNSIIDACYGVTSDEAVSARNATLDTDDNLSVSIEDLDE
jgi:recombination protein RecA